MKALALLIIVYAILALLFGGEPAAILIIAAYIGSQINEFFYGM